MEKRDFVLVIGGFSFLMLIVFLGLLLADKFKIKDCSCPKVVSYNFLWIFILLAVIFVGALVYYLFSFKIDKKEKIIQKNLEVIHSILDKEEEKVLNKLIKNNGELEQLEISKQYDKIRAHRIIKKLQEKKIIDIKKEGRANKIKLKEELKRELIK
jgi:hypothetical protein